MHRRWRSHVRWNIAGRELSSLSERSKQNLVRVVAAAVSTLCGADAIPLQRPNHSQLRCLLCSWNTSRKPSTKAPSVDFRNLLPKDNGECPTKTLLINPALGTSGPLWATSTNDWPMQDIWFLQQFATHQSTALRATWRAQWEDATRRGLGRQHALPPHGAIISLAGLRTVAGIADESRWPLSTGEQCVAFLEHLLTTWTEREKWLETLAAPGITECTGRVSARDQRSSAAATEVGAPAAGAIVKQPQQSVVEDVNKVKLHAALESAMSNASSAPSSALPDRRTVCVWSCVASFIQNKKLHLTDPFHARILSAEAVALHWQELAQTADVVAPVLFVANDESLSLLEQAGLLTSATVTRTSVSSGSVKPSLANITPHVVRLPSLELAVQRAVVGFAHNPTRDGSHAAAVVERRFLWKVIGVSKLAAMAEAHLSLSEWRQLLLRCPQLQSLSATGVRSPQLPCRQVPAERNDAIPAHLSSSEALSSSGNSTSRQAFRPRVLATMSGSPTAVTALVRDSGATTANVNGHEMQTADSYLASIFACPRRRFLENRAADDMLYHSEIFAVSVKTNHKTAWQRQDNPFAPDSCVTLCQWKRGKFDATAKPAFTFIAHQEDGCSMKTSSSGGGIASLDETVARVSATENVVLVMADAKKHLLYLRNSATVAEHILGLECSAGRSRRGPVGARVWCVFYAQYLLSGFRRSFENLDELVTLYQGMSPVSGSSNSSASAPPATDWDKLLFVYHGQVRAAQCARMALSIRERMEGLLASATMEIHGIAIDSVANVDKQLEVVKSEEEHLDAVLENALATQLVEPRARVNFNWQNNADVAQFLFGGGCVRFLAADRRSAVVPVLATPRSHSPTAQVPALLSDAGQMAQRYCVAVLSMVVTPSGAVKLMSLFVPLSRDNGGAVHFCARIVENEIRSVASAIASTVEPVPSLRATAATFRGGIGVSDPPLLSIGEFCDEVESCEALKALRNTFALPVSGNSSTIRPAVLFLVAGATPDPCAAAAVRSGVLQALCAALEIVDASCVTIARLASVRTASVAAAGPGGDSPTPNFMRDFEALEKGTSSTGLLGEKDGLEYWREEILGCGEREHHLGSHPMAHLGVTNGDVNSAQAWNKQKEVLLRAVASAEARVPGSALVQLLDIPTPWLGDTKANALLLSQHVQRRLFLQGYVWSAIRAAFSGNAEQRRTLCEGVRGLLVGSRDGERVPPTTWISVNSSVLDGLADLFTAHGMDASIFRALSDSRSNAKLTQLFQPERLLRCGTPLSSSSDTTPSEAPHRLQVVRGEILHWSTNTGRLSSQLPCVHNIPKHPLVRKLFVSRFGQRDGRIVEADYSQLEVVVLALLSGDRAMIQELRDAVDFHCLRVSLMTKVPYADVLQRVRARDPKFVNLRQQAKVFSFQRQYGAGVASICATSGLSDVEVRALIAAEEAHYPQLTNYYRLVQQIVGSGAQRVAAKHRQADLAMVSADGKVNTFASTILRQIEPVRYFPVFTGGKFDFSTNPNSIPMLKNHPVQGLAGELVQMMCGRLMRSLHAHPGLRNDRRLSACLVNSVHDCVWVDCHESVANVVEDLCRTVLPSVCFTLAQVYWEGTDAQAGGGALPPTLASAPRPDWLTDIPFPVTVHRGSSMDQL